MENPFKRIIKSVRLDNAEQSAVNEVGVDVDINTDDKSIDWGEELPDLIKPTIKNFRLCANKSSVVNGIIEDLVIKSISGWVVESDDESIKEYIEEELRRLDFMSVLHETARNNIIDGAMYYNVIVKDGDLYLRELAFDGDNYRIKEIYDDETGSEVIGYKQKVLKNKNTNKGWNKQLFNDLVEDLEEYEFNFYPDEVIATHFFTRHGVHKGMVENILDEAYMLNLLERMMPQVVFKQTNTMILHGGNKDRKEVNLPMRLIKKAVNAITNYHRKGVVYLPYGLDAEMVGDTNLPKIQNYCDFLEKSIFKGLSTPPSVFDGSSSNRSTAVVQLDSEKSGRVLFQQYLQNELFDFAQVIIDKLLDLRGKSKGSAWINFNPVTETIEEEEEYTNENGNISTSKSGDGLNLDNIQNGDGRLGEVSS